MQIDYFYNLTPRQYHNIESGYINKQNAKTKEIWHIARSVMYACLVPHSKNLKEKDILQFPWEQEVKQFTEEEQLELLNEVEIVKSFWEEQDKKKAAN